MEKFRGYVYFSKVHCICSFCIDNHSLDRRHAVNWEIRLTIMKKLPDDAATQEDSVSLVRLTDVTVATGPNLPGSQPCCVILFRLFFLFLHSELIIPIVSFCSALCLSRHWSGKLSRHHSSPHSWILLSHHTCLCFHAARMPPHTHFSQHSFCNPFSRSLLIPLPLLLFPLTVFVCVCVCP